MKLFVVVFAMLLAAALVVGQDLKQPSEIVMGKPEQTDELMVGKIVQPTDEPPTGKIDLPTGVVMGMPNPTDEPPTGKIDLPTGVVMGMPNPTDAIEPTEPTTTDVPQPPTLEKCRRTWCEALTQHPSTWMCVEPHVKGKRQQTGDNSATTTKVEQPKNECTVDEETVSCCKPKNACTHFTGEGMWVMQGCAAPNCQSGQELKRAEGECCATCVDQCNGATPRPTRECTGGVWTCEAAERTTDNNRTLADKRQEASIVATPDNCCAGSWKCSGSKCVTADSMHCAEGSVARCTEYGEASNDAVKRADTEQLAVGMPVVGLIAVGQPKQACCHKYTCESKCAQAECRSVSLCGAHEEMVPSEDGCCRVCKAKKCDAAACATMWDREWVEQETCNDVHPRKRSLEELVSSLVAVPEHPCEYNSCCRKRCTPEACERYGNRQYTCNADGTSDTKLPREDEPSREQFATAVESSKADGETIAVLTHFLPPPADDRCSAAACCKSPTDCSNVRCASPTDCPREQWVVPKGECCPRCNPTCAVMRCEPPGTCPESMQRYTASSGFCCKQCQNQCSGVLCMNVECEEGTVKMTPRGECCPRCVRPTCTDVMCSDALQWCPFGRELLPGRCCPTCKVSPCEQRLDDGTTVRRDCPMLRCRYGSYKPDGQCCPICRESCTEDEEDELKRVEEVVDGDVHVEVPSINASTPDREPKLEKREAVQEIESPNDTLIGVISGPFDTEFCDPDCRMHRPVCPSALRQHVVCDDAAQSATQRGLQCPSCRCEYRQPTCTKRAECNCAANEKIEWLISSDAEDWGCPRCRCACADVRVPVPDHVCRRWEMLSDTGRGSTCRKQVCVQSHPVRDCRKVRVAADGIDSVDATTSQSVALDASNVRECVFVEPQPEREIREELEAEAADDVVGAALSEAVRKIEFSHLFNIDLRDTDGKITAIVNAKSDLIEKVVPKIRTSLTQLIGAADGAKTVEINADGDFASIIADPATRIRAVLDRGEGKVEEVAQTLRELVTEVSVGPRRVNDKLFENGLFNLDTQRKMIPQSPVVEVALYDSNGNRVRTDEVLASDDVAPLSVCFKRRGPRHCSNTQRDASRKACCLFSFDDDEAAAIGAEARDEVKPELTGRGRVVTCDMSIDEPERMCFATRHLSTFGVAEDDSGNASTSSSGSGSGASSSSAASTLTLSSFATLLFAVAVVALI